MTSVSGVRRGPRRHRAGSREPDRRPAPTPPSSPGPHRARSGGGLPFGAVMATGAASQLSELAGLPAWRVPLLWLTILVAGWATGSGLVGWLGHGRAAAAPPPAARFGQFTIPVGLAVIGIGLARVAGPVALAGAVTAVVLAWAATLLLTAVVAIPAAAPSPGSDGPTVTTRINGTWFIAPAAYLASAAGAAALSHRAGAPPAGPVAWLAVACCGIGAVTYLAAVIVAVIRVRSEGRFGPPRVAWWIVVGCGGLAADALGHVGRAAPAGWLSGLAWVGLACWALASVVLVPVGLASLRHLVGLRHLSGHPPWPPAFSTAVFALGTAQVAGLFDLPWAAGLARIAAVETLVVWLVTSALHVGGIARQLRPASPET